jgi:hypothetical protein
VWAETQVLLGRVPGLGLGRDRFPFLLLVPGLTCFVGLALGGRATSVLAVPGSVATAAGLVLLGLQATGHWRAGAYAWALVFPAAFGLGLALHGRWGGRPGAVRAGRWLAGAGAGLCALLGVVLEALPGGG